MNSRRYGIAPPAIPPGDAHGGTRAVHRTLGAGTSSWSFETVPVACASVAQVHRAVLADGRRVAREGATTWRPFRHRPSTWHCSAPSLVCFCCPGGPQQYDPRRLVDEFATPAPRGDRFHASKPGNIEAIGRTFANDDIVTVPKCGRGGSVTESILTMELGRRYTPHRRRERWDAADIDRAGPRSSHRSCLRDHDLPVRPISRRPPSWQPHRHERWRSRACRLRRGWARWHLPRGG